MENPTIGHNNPPDPIDQICAQYDAEREEAENWCDGSPVENEAQMKSVDALRGSMRKWRIALEAGQKSAAAPLYDAYKSELDRWKPTIADAKRIESALVATVGAFKTRLADQKKAEERAAWEAANKARLEAEAKAAAADAANLEQQREVEALRQAAIDAENAAKAKKAEKPKGLRKVEKYLIEDHRAALHWIAKNDRDAITAFVDAYVQKNFKTLSIEGVKKWQEQEAF